MLDEIRAYLGSPDLTDDPFVRLDSIEFVDSDGIMTVRVMDHDGQVTWRKWVVRAKGMLDYEIREPHGDLALHEGDHVLARQHTDTHQDLTFRGVPRSAPEAVGMLLAAHREAVGDWIPFPRYLNACSNLGDLLAGGFGKLAAGPSFLMNVYATALEHQGIVPNLLSPRASRQWNGSQWVPTPARLAVLVIGNSYLVAEAFEETPATAEPANNAMQTDAASPRR